MATIVLPGSSGPVYNPSNPSPHLNVGTTTSSVFDTKMAQQDHMMISSGISTYNVDDISAGTLSVSNAISARSVYNTKRNTPESTIILPYSKRRKTNNDALGIGSLFEDVTELNPLQSIANSWWQSASEEVDNIITDISSSSVAQSVAQVGDTITNSFETALNTAKNLDVITNNYNSGRKDIFDTVKDLTNVIGSGIVPEETLNTIHSLSDLGKSIKTDVSTIIQQADDLQSQIRHVSQYDGFLYQNPFDTSAVKQNLSEITRNGQKQFGTFETDVVDYFQEPAGYDFAKQVPFPSDRGSWEQFVHNVAGTVDSVKSTITNDIIKPVENIYNKGQTFVNDVTNNQAIKLSEKALEIGIPTLTNPLGMTQKLVQGIAGNLNRLTEPIRTAQNMTQNIQRTISNLTQGSVEGSAENIAANTVEEVTTSAVEGGVEAVEAAVGATEAATLEVTAGGVAEFIGEAALASAVETGGISLVVGGTLLALGGLGYEIGHVFGGW